MKNKIIPYFFAIILGVAFIPGKVNASNQSLSFEIKLHGWATSDFKAYKMGKPITIRCVWKNISNQPYFLFLKDHDSYHGTLDYPTGISAKVVGSDGKVLTQNETSNEGWWSQYYLWSTIFKEEPGDTITLKPDEEVVRIIPLDKVLLGLEIIPNGLAEGTYTVQLMLNGLLSNELAIKIIKE